MIPYLPNYIDDDYENCPEYIAPYPPSGLWGVSLEAGEYYIVVDGYLYTAGLGNTFLVKDTGRVEPETSSNVMKAQYNKL